MNRKLLSVAIALYFVGVVPPLFAGSIGMSSTGNGNSVTIDLVINDDYMGPNSCSYLGLTRGEGGPIIQVITRQPGITNLQVVDTGLQPNTVYCYRMVMLQLPIPFPLYCGNNPSSLCNDFECFYDIQTCSNTGPDPAFIAHGFLTTQGTTPNETAALIVPCSGAFQIGLFSVSGTAQQYVDSGIAVNVYGTMERGGLPQGVWYYVAQAATPQPCVVATAPVTWGAVKSLYRN